MDHSISSVAPNGGDPLSVMEAEMLRLRLECAAAADGARTAERARDLALAEMDAHQERLVRVLALCDMAEWAAESEGSAHSPSVRVDDIRRALQVERDDT